MTDVKMSSSLFRQDTSALQQCLGPDFPKAIVGIMADYASDYLLLPEHLRSEIRDKGLRSRAYHITHKDQQPLISMHPTKTDEDYYRGRHPIDAANDRQFFNDFLTKDSIKVKRTCCEDEEEERKILDWFDLEKDICYYEEHEGCGTENHGYELTVLPETDEPGPNHYMVEAEFDEDDDDDEDDDGAVDEPMPVRFGYRV